MYIQCQANFGKSQKVSDSGNSKDRIDCLCPFGVQKFIIQKTQNIFKH